MEKQFLEDQILLHKSTNQIAKETNKGVSTIKYWFNKYNLKTLRQQRKVTNTKICPHCKKEKSLDEFYKRRGNQPSVYCKQCTKIQALTRQQNFKKQCLDYKGGKCLSCDYNNYQGALEFHHLDPNEKEFDLSSVKHNSFNEKIKEELDKCILLCSNCHKEIHGGLISYDEINHKIIKQDINKLSWEPKKSVPISDTIDIEQIVLKLQNKTPIKEIAKDLNIAKNYLLLLLHKNNIFLSEIEEQKEILHPKKIQWPSKEELEKLLWEKPTTYIAKDLGVSDKAVEKHVKKLGLTKPPRGYWIKQKNTEKA